MNGEQEHIQRLTTLIAKMGNSLKKIHGIINKIVENNKSEEERDVKLKNHEELVIELYEAFKEYPGRGFFWSVKDNAGEPYNVDNMQYTLGQSALAQVFKTEEEKQAFFAQTQEITMRVHTVYNSIIRKFEQINQSPQIMLWLNEALNLIRNKQSQILESLKDEVQECLDTEDAIIEDVKKFKPF